MYFLRFVSHKGSVRCVVCVRSLIEEDFVLDVYSGFVIKRGVNHTKHKSEKTYKVVMGFIEKKTKNNIYVFIFNILSFTR